MIETFHFNGDLPAKGYGSLVGQIRGSRYSVGEQGSSEDQDQATVGQGGSASQTPHLLVRSRLLYTAPYPPLPSAMSNRYE